jgi:5-methylcytosine-specific restriction endonuclease McrA
MNCQAISIEEMDFFNLPAYRHAILRREEGRCFYCLRAINAENYVIEHVVSRPNGNNSYRNLVAACRQCNNRKGALPAEDFMRMLYRDEFLDATELENRFANLRKLQSGELKPVIQEESLN